MIQGFLGGDTSSMRTIHQAFFDWIEGFAKTHFSSNEGHQLNILI
jgi:hypothetical protein